MFYSCRFSSCLLATVCGFAASAILAAQAVLFIPQTEFAAGVDPVSLAIANFSDGKRNLAVLNRGGAAVSMLFGIGNGFFQPLTTQDVGLNPSSFATGDFNRDGKLDLLVANYGSNTISVLLGNGNGIFHAGIPLQISHPSFILAADFNGDEKLDLAVASEDSGSISIFLGNGDGTFRAPQHFAVGSGPVWIAAGDFNHDGKIDLVTANLKSNTISVLLGNGNGLFRGAFTFAAGAAPASLAIGDFNGDGNLDVAVANAIHDGTVSILLGNGDGVFRSFLSFAVGPNPSFIIAADLNLDGTADLAVANTGGETISILLGRGNGLFLPRYDFPVGTGPSWIGVSDLDADGKPDLAVANSGSNSVSILLNRTFAPDQPTIADHGVVNSASYYDGSVAPGEVVTIFGSNLGPVQLTPFHATQSHLIDNVLAGTRVLFDGIPAPLLYARADQLGAIVPFGVAGHATTQVLVEHQSLPSATLTLPVVNSALGLFTANASGKGPAAILNQDLSVNSRSNPAPPGSIVVLYATGAGLMNPAGVDGELTGSALSRPVLPVSVAIDGKDAQVLYAGSAPGLVAGVIQINVRIPDGVHSGAVPVLLRVGGRASQSGVTVAIQ